MALCEAAGGGASLAWPRVLLFGDSITQFSFQQGGWGASLADKLVRKCDVLNRGFSGYNTRWAKIILPRLITKGNSLESPAAVTIFFGANDSALKDENPKQHVPLAEYAANLHTMVRQLSAAGVPASRVVLVSPPPLCEAAWEQACLLQGAAGGLGGAQRFTSWVLSHRLRASSPEDGPGGVLLATVASERGRVGATCTVPDNHSPALCRRVHSPSPLCPAQTPSPPAPGSPHIP
ncbi:isoamyl acetate-hydrolyzing esterase 1 homolog isoform X2 [Meles meles]|uniref:isoamyl acetate-hydrolyzing esterase 1 homolog isoform X2 n=1 Tax=Meles meles TaxID=9662 RepID=UPI001E6A0FD4|nr:isoamyl acetate-hydrolyzing esterase 1 homolog isoform X2 [Meles meles]